MQNLYDEVGSLDKRCYDEYGLNEDILMEHAALGISSYIRDSFVKNSRVTIVCGSGNNGADGLVVARQLHKDYDVSIYYAKEVKSKMALLQARRAKNLSIKECIKIKDCDILVDAILGTGFEGQLSDKIQKIMKKMNLVKAFKIACDVPSGYEFYADLTFTMGALKKSMFLDSSKDKLGEIKVVNLGISRDVYEKDSYIKLLDLNDFKAPCRDKKDTHKGNFGHLAVAMGEKNGASILSAKAALRFGAGLVTVISKEKKNIPDMIMQSVKLPSNTTALALGMGLADEKGRIEIADFLENSLPIVADADIFSSSLLCTILKRENVILTPHPKEFIDMLRELDLTDITVQRLQEDRFKYVELFCQKYKTVTLLLKGANVIIAKDKEYFVNSHGTSALAKGGSGDVLSGLIGSLLAQGYSCLDAAINASLAHTKLAQNYNGADFSLTPDDLIDGICKL